MENFEYHNPIKILFGKGKVSALAANIPANAKVLITYGGGSIKANGVYDQVKAALTDIEVLEFGGIEANPTFETAMKAVELVKAENIDFLLAVGGGSVLDATKFIAAAVKFEGEDAWDIVANGATIKEALPLACVLTLPATGSEVNGNSVISRKATQEKMAFGSPLIMPQFSVLDPEYTFSLPKRQVINGVVDAFMHVLEQYLTYPVDSPVQDRLAEGILVTLIEEGRKVVANEKPVYENKANIMWAASMALNGLVGVGVKSDWTTHSIGHELTAYHGLDHALTLAIVLPGLMQQLRVKREAKFLQFGERVWNIKEGSVDERLDATIATTDAFCRALGLKTKLGENGVGQDTIDKIIARFESRGVKKLGAQQDVDIADVKAILTSRL